MGEPTIRVLSLGAGVQSTTLLLLAIDGTLAKPDAAIFADTGWEPAGVYAHLTRLEKFAADAGIPIHHVVAGNLRADALDPAHRFASMPLFITNRNGSPGMSRRQCTSEYKLKPIKAAVRQLLGYPYPTPIPASVWAEQWIGFSTDEIHRVVDRLDVRYTRPRYPLLDLNMSRKDCQRWLTAHGWADVPKSACVGCPFHGNRQWREMRDHRPDEWADAVDFDRAIRARHPNNKGQDLLGSAFLHASRVPLDRAPIDRVSRYEWTDRQTDIYDALTEDGDPDGCSPYGCRSGQPTPEEVPT